MGNDGVAPSAEMPPPVDPLAPPTIAVLAWDDADRAANAIRRCRSAGSSVSPIHSNSVAAVSSAASATSDDLLADPLGKGEDAGALTERDMRSRSRAAHSADIGVTAEKTVGIDAVTTPQLDSSPLRE